ncbi:potassium channel family protein, partial [Adlercreutzia equolifaciens]
NFNGSTVQGVGFDEDVLIRAGVEECDVLAAVTQLDNTNLMCAEVANHLFGVPHVISRLYNPDHERAYMQLGIDYVCGTSLVAEDVFSKIVSGHGSHIDTFGEFEVLRFTLDLSSRDNAKTIRVSELERDHEVRIIAFERADGSASSIPTPDSLLYAGDSILACVRHDVIAQFSRYILD